VEAGERFGLNIRRMREAAGMSQEALADAAEVHLSEVSRVERAERDLRLSTILRLAAGLNVRPAKLFDGL
jgi:transcriptional regulator with XRE-family HTH domain